MNAIINHKIPFAQSANILAQKRALDAISVLGQNLPCSVTAVSGSIVTVKFEVKSGFNLGNVTCPVFGPEYIRYPIQNGCKGMLVSAAAFLGGLSGLGSGVADLSLPANLSAVIFLPFGNKTWSATDDPNAVVIYGPNGAVIRTLDSTVKLVVSETGIVMTLPAGTPFTINGDIHATGAVIAGFGGVDQINLQTHKTAGVTTGPSQTTLPPVPGT